MNTISPRSDIANVNVRFVVPRSKSRSHRERAVHPRERFAQGTDQRPHPRRRLHAVTYAEEKRIAVALAQPGEGATYRGLADPQVQCGGADAVVVVDRDEHGDEVEIERSRGHPRYKRE